MKLLPPLLAFFAICCTDLTLARYTIAASNATSFSTSASPFKLYSLPVPQPFALHEDLLVISAPLGNAFEIRRRNEQGEYVLKNTISTTGVYPITNGEWLCSIDNDGLFSTGKWVDDELVDLGGILPFHSYEVSGAKFFEDGTMVLFVEVEDDDNETFALVTLGFNSSISEWSVIQQTDLFNEGNFKPLNLGSPLIAPSACFSDKYFFGVNVSNEVAYFTLMERQADLSWTTIAQIQLFDQYYISGLAAYNGIDTIVLTSPFGVHNASLGEISIFNRTANGNWILNKVFTAFDLGYRGVALLGFSLDFLDPTTFIVSAPFENLDMSSFLAQTATASGKMCVISRNGTTGQWEPTFDIATSGDVAAFGAGFAFTNNEEILTFGHSSTVNNTGYHFLLPKCQVKPINATCLTVHLDDCSNIDVTTLCSVNAGLCDVNVTHSELNNATSSVVVTASFTFTLGEQTKSCEATVYCTAPPSATPVASDNNSHPQPKSPPSPAISKAQSYASLGLYGILLLSLLSL